MRGPSTVQGFGLDAFRAKFKDGARNYTFYIDPIFPTVNGISSYGGTDMVQYLVQSSTMPQINNNPVSAHWQGMDYKLATVQSFSNWTLNYVVDREAVVYDKYYKWFTYIHNPQTGLHGDPTQYMVDQAVQLVDAQDYTQFIEAVELYGAFPVDISQITLDYSNRNLVTFSVTYAYQYHMPITSLTNKSG
jgi:hypothetical protein